MYNACSPLKLHPCSVGHSLLYINPTTETVHIHHQTSTESEMAWESSQTINTDKDSGEPGFLNDSVEVHVQSREAGTPNFRGRMRYSQKTDTGWAWVICFGSFMCNVILDGMLFSFGIFFVHFLDYFDAGKGRTALVGSAFMGTHLLLGEYFKDFSLYGTTI